MFKLTDDRSKKGTPLAKVVMQTLSDVMNSDDKVVFLEADLAGASSSTIIQKDHPDRFIQVGIAEANMIGTAAGLSVEGFKPFVHTFGPFATRRVYDQLYLSGAYAHNTINVYGSDPGFCTGPNGGTHTTWEDVALMRAMPTAVVCDAADAVQLEWIVRKFATMQGIHYFRANRKDVRNVYAEGSTFELGKGNVLKEGKDVLIITAGQIVSDALDAAEKLEAEGISAEVIDMFTIKPLDADLILSEVKGKKAVVTFENHSIIGGLGSAVAEVLAEHAIAVPFKRHGANDVFGQVASQEWLQKEFKLTADDLIETVKGLL
ncbi:MAG: alpha-ketoacid dehydrogenase subunit beta [Erysipelotrichaceae bacterium]|nr:alpha-ketoacid dehydrogenase subunit beta [Erysipelotrichaceae bacterium]